MSQDQTIVTPYTRFGIGLMDSIASQAQGVEDHQRGQVEQALTSGWEKLYNQVPSLEKWRPEGQRVQDLDEQPGFQALSRNGRRAFGALYVFCQQPGSYINSKDQDQVVTVLGQILPSIMTATDKAGITLSAEAQQAFASLPASGGTHRKDS